VCQQSPYVYVREKNLKNEKKNKKNHPVSFVLCTCMARSRV
jgi:hypothetical protein